MGDTCYRVTEDVSDGAIVYAHSRKDGREGYCYLIINNSLTDEMTVHFDKQVELFPLAGKDGMRSKVMCLDSRPLQYDADGTISILEGRKSPEGRYYLAPGSCMFVVI
jgi:hypothetical protein